MLIEPIAEHGRTGDFRPTSGREPASARFSDLCHRHPASKEALPAAGVVPKSVYGGNPEADLRRVSSSVHVNGILVCSRTASTESVNKG
jgi:hypothetical protein